MDLLAVPGPRQGRKPWHGAGLEDGGDGVAVLCQERLTMSPGRRLAQLAVMLDQSKVWTGVPREVILFLLGN